MSSGPHILIATGGSGGHLYPAIAVAEELERRWPQARVRLTTGSRAIEREICASAGRTADILPLIPSSDARRHPIRFARSFWAATRTANALLSEFRPHCVVGTGGYPMTPVIHRALRAKAPVILLEQNAVPGRATRWFSRKVSAVCSSFKVLDPPLARSRVEITGNPVRAAIARLSAEPPAERTSWLVLGGSQGARGLNEAFRWIALHHPEILAGKTVVHQTGGDESARELSSLYRTMNISARVSPFIVDMASEYRQAALIIARAGATTLAELACAGVPALLVPYPYARDRHQHRNAQVFAEHGAALVIEQGPDGPTTGASMLSTITNLGSHEALASMSRQMRGLAKPDATARVVDQIERLLQ